MRITLGCGCGAMPKHSANQIEALPMRHGCGRKTMAQVMYAYIGKTCPLPNSLPGFLDAGEISPAPRAREHKLALPTMLFGNPPQHFQGGLGEGHRFGAGLAVGKA